MPQIFLDMLLDVSKYNGCCKFELQWINEVIDLPIFLVLLGWIGADQIWEKKLWNHIKLLAFAFKAGLHKTIIMEYLVKAVHGGVYILEVTVIDFQVDDLHQDILDFC